MDTKNIDKIRDNWWDRVIGRRVKLNGRPLTKLRILNSYVLFQMYQGRGSGLIQNLTRVQEFALLALTLKVYFSFVTVSNAVVLGIVYMIMTAFLGYFDYRKINLWQVEEELNTSYVNPFNQRIERRLCRIEKHFNIDQGEDK